MLRNNTKKNKSGNFTRSNREKSNIHIVMLEKGAIEQHQNYFTFWVHQYYFCTQVFQFGIPINIPVFILMKIFISFKYFIALIIKYQIYIEQDIFRGFLFLLTFLKQLITFLIIMNRFRIERNPPPATTNSKIGILVLFDNGLSPI